LKDLGALLSPDGIIGSPDERSRREAVIAERLQLDKAARGKLIGCLTDADQDTRRGAVMMMIANTPLAKEGLPMLIQVLQTDKSANVRSFALRAVQSAGTRKKAVITAIARAAEKDADPEIRSEALDAIATLRPKSRNVNDLLLRALRDRAVEVRRTATRHLQFQRSFDKEALNTILLAVMNDSDPKVRAELIFALRSPRQRTQQVKTVLVESLQDKAEAVRLQAVAALVEFDTLGSATIPIIKSLQLESQDPDAFARLIGGVGKEIAPELFKVVVSGGSAHYRARAALALAYVTQGHATPLLRQSLQTLTQLMKHEASYVRAAATHALALMGAEARLALPDLIQSLKDSNVRVRMWTVASLKTLAPAEQAAANALATALLQDQSPGIRIEAASALGKCGKQHPRVVPLLIRALDDQDDGVQCAAAQALGSIGAPAKAAVPALRAALHSKNDFLKEEARGALERIGAGKMDKKP